MTACHKNFLPPFPSPSLSVTCPPSLLVKCGHGGIGRRTALRWQRGDPWKFEST